MNNVTVLTGGTSGIGKAIAFKILKESDENDKLIVVYGHNEDAARCMMEEIAEADKEKVILMKADMSEYEAMFDLVTRIKQVVDHIDWLVLNTGIGTYLPFEEYTPDIWEKVIRTNLSVPALFVKELKDVMAEQGNILFMGSHAGQVPYSSSVVYSVSKAGVHMLAQSLMKCFDDKRISVNAIAPGFIETKWQDGRSEESRERINSKIAAHRFGTPEEVAELSYAVLNNDYLNGSIFNVHGGYAYF